MMKFRWFKRMMPRGLYGRGAVILLFPIVTLQLMVSVAIMQRYFEGVARQMTQTAILDLRLVLDELNRAPDTAATIATALQIDMQPAPTVTVQRDARSWDDLTGIEVTRVLRTNLPELIAVDLRTDWRQAHIMAQTHDGPVMLSMRRSRLSASNPHQLIVLTIFIGMIMAGVAYLFLRNQLRPIRRLAHAAEAFGKGRMVNYTPSGATEVRSAGRAFLDMRARIDGMIEQRTLMLSGVSHDLRTPLTRMKLSLSMLDHGAEVDALSRDVAEMESLLTTFLDFARGETLDDPVTTDPIVLANRVVEDAKRTGGIVEFTAPSTGSQVLLRPQAVHRALTNMVSNALRYGTKAQLTVRLPERAVRFIIEDDGPGIPPEHREDALRPFIRLDVARNQDQGLGVGLGLAIARDIAQRHGGTLTLGQSVNLGGLRIEFVLPR